jgi:hypothetical protein
LNESDFYYRRFRAQLAARTAIAISKNQKGKTFHEWDDHIEVRALIQSGFLYKCQWLRFANDKHKQGNHWLFTN